MNIDIISTEFIKPSSPTPSHLQKFRLSFLDQCMPAHFFPLIFYYFYNDTSNITQSAMCFQLKRSLSDALTHFYPLAGRIEGQGFVDCNDQGVKYLEARVDSRLSDIIEFPQVTVLNQLIPYNLSDACMLKAEEQLAIQVNLFKCGGIVLGTCISHKIADACTLSNFINSWAAIARRESNLVFPIFNSAVMFPPRDPSLSSMTDAKNQALMPPVERLVTKQFIFTDSAISALKENVVETIRPTRVEIVTAFIWKCVIKKGKTSAVFHPVNLRGRMVPPLPIHSFGNIFQMASAVINGQDYELSFLVNKLRTAFAKLNSEHTKELLGKNGFEFAMSNFKNIGKLMSQKDMKVLRCTSWCRFPIYEADFGWGKPCWVSSASVPTKDTIILLDSRQTCGIEAWIIMKEQDMAEFEQDHDLQKYVSSNPDKGKTSVFG